MRLPTHEIQKVYQRHTKHYDIALQLYRLIGWRQEAYRSRGWNSCVLKKGDCVVDLGVWDRIKLSPDYRVAGTML